MYSAYILKKDDDETLKQSSFDHVFFSDLERNFEIIPE